MIGKRPVGFSRRVKYEWLEYTAKLCMNAVGVADRKDSVSDRVGSCKGESGDAVGAPGTKDTAFSLIGPCKEGRKGAVGATDAKDSAPSFDSINEAKIREGLRDYLVGEGFPPVGVTSTNREKVVSVLSRTWATTSSHLVELRNAALRLYPKVKEPERLVLHWGLVSAAYPFVFDVAEVVGRLLRLQQTIRLYQVRGRVEDIAGQRPTIYHAVPKVLRSFVDWRVLGSPLNGLGVYSSACKVPVQNEGLLAWLVEAVLRTKSSPALPLTAVINSPGLFPFFIEPGSVTDYVLRKNPRLVRFRQAVEQDMVGV